MPNSSGSWDLQMPGWCFPAHPQVVLCSIQEMLLSVPPHCHPRLLRLQGSATVPLYTHHCLLCSVDKDCSDGGTRLVQDDLAPGDTLEALISLVSNTWYTVGGLKTTSRQTLKSARYQQRDALIFPGAF